VFSLEFDQLVGVAFTDGLRPTGGHRGVGRNLLKFAIQELDRLRPIDDRGDIGEEKRDGLRPIVGHRFREVRPQNQFPR
jgi:hypothetical protein